MANPLIITFVILLTAIGLLLSERLRADLIALLVVVALGVTGVLLPRETFSGFSSSAVVTIVAIFILTEALRLTGVTERVGDLLLRLAGAGERRLVVIVMLAGALLSLVMNNIAAAAVLLPAVSGIARRARVSPARLLMPLAFATILGGMATLFTTTNIVVSGVLRSQNLGAFGVLDFAPLGVPLVTVGVLYMALWGQRLLPDRPVGMRACCPRGRAARWSRSMAWASASVSACYVKPGSAMAGLSLHEGQYGVNLGLTVVNISQGRNVNLALQPPNLVLAAGDVIWLEGKLDEHGAGRSAFHLELTAHAGVERERPGVSQGEPGGGDAGAALDFCRGHAARAALRREVRDGRLALWREAGPCATGWANCRCSSAMRCCCKAGARRSNCCAPTPG